MTDLVATALIASVPSTLVALAAVMAALRKMNGLHIMMNSKLDEVVQKTAEASFAKGKAAGVEEEREEVRQRIASKEPRVKSE